MIDAILNAVVMTTDARSIIPLKSFIQSSAVPNLIAVIYLVFMYTREGDFAASRLAWCTSGRLPTRSHSPRDEYLPKRNDVRRGMGTRDISKKLIVLTA